MLIVAFLPLSMFVLLLLFYWLVCEWCLGLEGLALLCF
jgi:hypothetical protein